MWMIWCSKNFVLFCLSMMKSLKGSGYIFFVWSRVVWLMVCGSGSWRRFGLSCGCRFSF